MIETLAEAPFATTDGPQRHASYAALAATAPVHRITLPTGQSAWLITGYNEARHALADPRLVKSEVTAANTGRGLLPGEVYAAMGSHMLKPQSAGPHPIAPAGRYRIHPPPRRSTYAAHPADHQRAARRHGHRRAARPDRLVCTPAADHRDLRATRCADRPPHGVPRLDFHRVS